MQNERQISLATVQWSSDWIAWLRADQIWRCQEAQTRLQFGLPVLVPPLNPPSQFFPPPKPVATG